VQEVASRDFVRGLQFISSAVACRQAAENGPRTLGSFADIQSARGALLMMGLMGIGRDDSLRSVVSTAQTRTRAGGG
jgi:hypothetical protein